MPSHPDRSQSLLVADTEAEASPFDTQPSTPKLSPDEEQSQQQPQHVVSEKPITKQPSPSEGMTMYPPKLSLSASGSECSSSQESGYRRQQSEMTEFLTELFLCFGVFNNVCPHDGAGCVTMVATFCGNTCFSCCKVK
ncbi:hypothetical protein DIRU0_C27842 [Diutina rugosa]